MRYKITAINTQWFSDDIEQAKEIAIEEAKASGAWAKVSKYVDGQHNNHPCQQVFICTFYDGKYEESDEKLDIKQPKRPNEQI